MSWHIFKKHAKFIHESPICTQVTRAINYGKLKCLKAKTERYLHDLERWDLNLITYHLHTGQSLMVNQTNSTPFSCCQSWDMKKRVGAGMASKGGGGGQNTHTHTLNVADWVGQILTELDHQKWPTLIFCLIKEFELVKPQHWPTRVGYTSTLTDSSQSNLNIDRLETVKPQHWPTRAGQTSILTDRSWSNLHIYRLESVKPRHRPTRVGQICLYHPPPPPPITYPWSHPWVGARKGSSQQ